ncbi:MAG: diguanylate cyclase [Solirubrobacteraceae bacterium]
MQDAATPPLTQGSLRTSSRGQYARALRSPSDDGTRERASWLIGDEMDRGRMLDMDRLIAPVRQKSFVVIAVALLICKPWLGWWTIIPLAVAGVAFRLADDGLEHVTHTEYLLLAVAFGVNAHAVIEHPPLLVMPLALTIAVAILSTALMHSDVRHRSEAVLDQLTGMLNRHALQDRTVELAHQSRRSSQPVGLIVGDLEHFKDVNDTHGHATGDAVLQDVAYMLRKQLRAFDLAYRLGGEEFRVLLPGADLHQSIAIAERLREGVEADTVGGGLRMTMSFGVSASEAGGVFDYKTVCSEADAALYEAKRGGRNAVRSHAREGLPAGEPSVSS